MLVVQFGLLGMALCVVLLSLRVSCFVGWFCVDGVTVCLCGATLLVDSVGLFV